MYTYCFFWNEWLAGERGTECFQRGEARSDEVSDKGRLVATKGRIWSQLTNTTTDCALTAYVSPPSTGSVPGSAMSFGLPSDVSIARRQEPGVPCWMSKVSG